MTRNPLLATLLPLVADLSRELPESERYRRLLEALRGLLPCDATALLRLEGDQLVPLAVDGLSQDTLGRRFKISEHPRLRALIEHPGPTHFAADCGLPDPYDGLVEGLHGHLEVHDCLGCPLFLDEQPWGLLTLDALDPERFSTGDLDNLEAFASLAAATVKASQRMTDLAQRAEHEQQRADAYQRASGDQPRELIGQSKSHQALMHEIQVVAGSDLSVLITGETGVGKELVAQSIHANSLRRTQPLVSLNCAALPETLVESELFGHVRGAFSGAVGERRGKFELADGGTLFLDEVGELPLAIQAKLLRVLQSGQLQRLGSDREHHVDVRLIAATNRDLAEEVRAGRFRADLYHRLSVYPLRVPPLRERGNDILLLAGYFLEQNRPRLGLRSLRLTREAQAALVGYAWPGNVRELEHLIGRASLKALANHSQRSRILSLGVDDLTLSALQGGVPAADAKDGDSGADTEPAGELRPAVDAFQRRMISQSLERHEGNWAAVAREMGLDRANLNRLARRLAIK
ncbi:nitric oxide reductase transcriptional regulator NorR [Pseudomonas sp. GD04087]|uniref:nitric oxide reductase transcriptional regulator NorR n=1 Tax=unclassified Pseudomonas TaxID=196821 RepID=UPI0024487EED|nr:MULTISPECIES: nitric oxide reductase transcriptional regulator NorR [unclassified Pseudomonas]MDH0293522.1 nitric oxide reductase transcriptional regulator NorR [Pseudomonas sp. GD04087]MDH1053089.1 nitric oxide reductase transcriptional regulator NorR [Pseudomonas sp. GD03903]MDH2003770.1 nitric oxide reductase transcriptional regulator NorR [Pseudomonas sp. GD03691]